jgi:DNA-binding transcriptional regulator YiaG
MTIHDALCHFDHSQANIARALGVSVMTICNWKRNKHIPFQWQCQLQVITNGALKASEKD